MTISCEPLDPLDGAAAWLGPFLECQSRALGENGFQALAGSPLIASLLAISTTIFVALIGYRLLLGPLPGMRDGIGWMVRLGIVLTLVTSWPVFQTLIYRIATEAPEDIAALLLPAAGIATEEADARIQAAYDRIRQSATPVTAQGTPAQQGAPQSSAQQVAGPSGAGGMANIASLFVAATRGAVGALHLATGFLLAMGPLAALCLLFPGTWGIFEGWLRALLGSALGGLAAMLSACLELVAVETELAHQDLVQMGVAPSGAADPQGVTTVILVFMPILAALLYAAWRVAGALRLARPSIIFAASPEARRPSAPDAGEARHGNTARGALATNPPAERPRSMAVANALMAATRRDGMRFQQGGIGGTATSVAASGGAAATGADMRRLPLGIAGRRSHARATRSASRRDMKS